MAPRKRKMSKEDIKRAADRAEKKKPEAPEAVLGRPPKYEDGFAKQAEKLCRLGATNVDLADFFEVNIRTIERWSTTHEAFCRALKAGKEEADDKVERSLYQRATGYTFDSEKVQILSDGSIVRAPIREHVPPDTTSMIFWLKNRKKYDWRDKINHELTGEDGGPIETQDLSARDRAKAIAAVLAAGVKAAE